MILRNTFFLLLFSTFWISSEAQSFRLGMHKNKDSMSYFVVNQTDQLVNAGAIICTWFHNTDEMVFWPADLGIGLGTVSVPGQYDGKKVSFSFRTTQRISFDFDILPGDSQEFVTVQNYSNVPQEVMCTNIRVFYFDTAGNDSESDVYVNNQDICPFKQVYILSNYTSDGIRFWTSANRLLHASNTCTTGFDVVVIHRSTLEPTPVAGITPLCADGRKWKSFGHPKDEQVYYHFDFTDTTQIAQFVTFVDAISPGDHVFFAHSSRNAVNLTDVRVRKALESLGAYPNNSFSDSKTMVGYGNKLSNAGTLEMFPGLAVKKEYVLLPDQVYDPKKTFAPCFEATLAKVDKAQEPIDTNSNRTMFLERPISVSPNPFNEKLKVLGSFPQEKIELIDLSGKKISLEIQQFSGYAELQTSELATGMYLLRVGNRSVKVMKQ